MVKGKTPSGYKFAVDEGIRTDWLFLKALNKANSENVQEKFDGQVHLVSVIFGNDKAEKEYYEFVAAKHNGRVPLDVLTADLKAIVDKIGQGNNDIKK